MISRALPRPHPELLRSLVDASPVLMWVKDKNRRFLYANRAMQRLIGRRRDEIIGRRTSTVFRRHPHAVRLTPVDEAVLGGRSIKSRETFFLGGRARTLLVVRTPIRNRAGSIVAIAGTGTDITDLSSAEAALRRSQSSLTLLADAVPNVATFTLDARGYVFTWNRRAERARGFTKKTILGKHYSVMFPPDQRRRVPGLLREAARVGRAEDIGWRVRSDGSRFLVRVVIRPLRGPNRELTGFSVASEDITERERIRQSELTSRNIIEAEDAERARLSRDLHDGAGQLLWSAKLKLDALNVAVVNPVKFRRTASEIATTIGTAIREIRLISRNLGPPPLEQLGLEGAVKEMVQEQSVVTGVRIRFSSRAVPVLPHPIQLGIYRIAQEALSNAARHAKAARIDVTLRRADGRLVLRVADDGRGFSMARRARERGMGLKSMMDRAGSMGGKLSVSTRRMKGTTIQLSLPLEGY